MYSEIAIPTYIINLKKRTDRLAYVLQQFDGKKEFDIHIVEAYTHTIGAVGLWKSIVHIINEAKKSDDDVIIICEDDHTFTEYYNRDLFIQHIIEAAGQGVEILSGGIGGFGNAVPITQNRFWIDSFWCTQFIILYRPVFDKILSFNFSDTDTADGVLSELTSHKMVIYPFISVQHDFGYSDVTHGNNEVKGKIEKHFEDSNKKMEIYYKAYESFLK